MAIQNIHGWDRLADGAEDRVLMFWAPLLLAGWLALSSWAVLSLGGLAGLSAPAATGAAVATGPSAGHLVVSIGAVQLCSDH
jgi:hypothetical protein